MTASQADYEIELIRQFKKLEQFWQNKKPEKFISKCVFFLEVYGVSPSLNVGFEEALFLAGKIKNDLRGSLSTEKVLYLLFLTLQKQLQKTACGKNGRKQQHPIEEQDSEEESPLEKESSTFRSFIIRYLYYLREQRILNQVQKMTSLEQVRAQFRSKADSQYLQFHEIETLKERDEARALPPKFDCQPSSLEVDGESCAAEADDSSNPSSRNNPELCARNSHGQFVNRKRVPTTDWTSDQVSEGSSMQALRKREDKIQQKEASIKTKFDRKQGLLGKRSRPKEEGLYQLLDTPGQVFTQRAAGADHEDQFAAKAHTRIFEIIKSGKKVVSHATQNSHLSSDQQLNNSLAPTSHPAQSFTDLYERDASTQRKPVICGLYGGNRSSQGEEEEESSLEQASQQLDHQAESAAANLEDQKSENQDQESLQAPQNPEQRQTELSNQQSRRAKGDFESDKTLTEKSHSACNESQRSSKHEVGCSSQRLQESEVAGGPSQSEDIIDNLAKQGHLSDQSRDAQMAKLEKLYDEYLNEDAEDESGEQEVEEEEEMSGLESSDEKGEVPSHSQAKKQDHKQTPSKRKGALQSSGDIDMRDEEGTTPAQEAGASSSGDSSSSGPGAITKCYTVIKLEHKKKQVASTQPQQQASRGEADSDSQQTCKEETPSKKSSDVVKQAGIYQMLMQVTHGLKPKKTPKKPTASISSTTLQKQESQSRQQKKNDVDPQVELYQEQDIKTALNYQTLVAKGDVNINALKRRPRQNYLAYTEPFDLNILLDNNYWAHKSNLLSHQHDEIDRLSALNKLDVSHSFQNQPIHDFLDFKEPVESPAFKVKHLYWHNEIDTSVPYQSGFKEHFWNYIQSNEITNDNIRQYLQKAKRQTFCNCLDGCQNSRKCPCYKWNRKLQNPTYNKEMSPRSGQMIAFQQRAKTSINKVFTFNECHPRCACNKDLCLNYLVAAQNKKKFRFLVRRMKKTLSPIYQSFQGLSDEQSSKHLKGGSQSSPTSNKMSSATLFPQVPKDICMWGLIAMEEIPAGAFLMEYLGEIVSKKQGDMRGTFYDDNGLSYLFDLNDPSESDEREQIIQKVYYNEFFPLCLDSMFYGNEARFINHSCDPNVQSFNLTGQVQSNVYHSIGLFASRKILPGEELTLDYQWDKNDLTISQDVPCLCGSLKCRGFLMRAKKSKKQNQNGLTNPGSLATSKQPSMVKDTGKESGEVIEPVFAVSMIDTTSHQQPSQFPASTTKAATTTGQPEKLFNVTSRATMQATTSAAGPLKEKSTFESRIQELRNGGDLRNTSSGEPRPSDSKTVVPGSSSSLQQQIFTTKNMSPQKLIKPVAERLHQQSGHQQPHAYHAHQPQPSPQRKKPIPQQQTSAQPQNQMMYANKQAQAHQSNGGQRGLTELLPGRQMMAVINQSYKLPPPLHSSNQASKVIFNPVILPQKQQQMGGPSTTNMTLPPASQFVRKAAQQNPRTIGQARGGVMPAQARPQQMQQPPQQQLHGPGPSDSRRFKQVKHNSTPQQPY